MESKPIRTPINKCTHIIAKTRHPLDLFVYMSLLLFSFCPLTAFCSYAPLKAQFIFFGNECAIPICHIEIMQMTDSINR